MTPRLPSSHRWCSERPLPRRVSCQGPYDGVCAAPIPADIGLAADGRTGLAHRVRIGDFITRQPRVDRPHKRWTRCRAREA